MSPIIPLLALGALVALALGAKNKRTATVPMLPPYVPPPAGEPPPAPFEPPPEPAPPPPSPRPHGKREKPPAGPAPAPASPASAPSPASPPQTLPELAEKADEIFNAPSPPPILPPPPAASTAPGNVTPPPTPVAVPSAPTSVPAGFDPIKARRIAPRVASHLKTKGIANYSRQALREFQTLAGVKADGIYGGQTAGALRYYLGGATPPAPMFKPVQEIPYTPPGS